MRLICPNCDAQYEVPLNVMPTNGRDVQCSNCNHTWFQEHPDHVAEKATEDPASNDARAPEPEAPDRQDIEEPDQAAQPEPARPPKDDTLAPKRRTLDPSVADVLKAEAERESVARRKENETIESQPDLGLDDGDFDTERSIRAARASIPQMWSNAATEEKSEEEDLLPDAIITAAVKSRRDLLPNIDEINSTLRSNEDRAPTGDPGQTGQVETIEKRSSRRGFTLTVALFAILALAYVFAPQIAERIPQAETGITAYVAIVDDWRVWLDAQSATALSWLDNAVSAEE